jgi:serine/threonine protein kinase
MAGRADRSDVDSVQSARIPSLEDFKQIKLLGEGAFAAVYKVTRYADGGTYALKKVKLPSLSDKEKQNALNEIRLLASVRHENIISYKDAFCDERSRCLCIVTELADRGDLMAQIQKCQKDKTHVLEEDIWRYLIGLSHALNALHKVNIFHRDMKSANIFLGTNMVGKTIAKLGDFNVSAVAKRGLCMTQTGTPYYASPEIWRDMPYDGRSDIWGLGCVMYEGCGLKPPFTADDMEGLCKSVLRGKYKRIPSVYSDELSDVIGCMLQVNPRNRPSAEQILRLPVVLQRARQLDLAETGPGASDLLNTIKLPRKLIDLSAHLPTPQYESRTPSKTSDRGSAIDRSESCGDVLKMDKQLRKQLELPSIFETPSALEKKPRGERGSRRSSQPPSGGGGSRRHGERDHSKVRRKHRERDGSGHRERESSLCGLDRPSAPPSGRSNYARPQDLLEPPSIPPMPQLKSPAAPSQRLHLPRIASCPGGQL